MFSQKRYGLSSKERIKSKKDFNELYSSGKILISGDRKIKAVYLIKENSDSGVKIAAVVSKKLGNAVWRNRLRRIIKEAYRLNKQAIIESASRKNKNLKLILSAYALSGDKDKNINLREIVSSVVEILNKIKKSF